MPSMARSVLSRVLWQFSANDVCWCILTDHEDQSNSEHKTNIPYSRHCLPPVFVQDNVSSDLMSLARHKVDIREQLQVFKQKMNTTFALVARYQLYACCLTVALNRPMYVIIRACMTLNKCKQELRQWRAKINLALSCARETHLPMSWLRAIQRAL